VPRRTRRNSLSSFAKRNPNSPLGERQAQVVADHVRIAVVRCIGATEDLRGLGDLAAFHQDDAKVVPGRHEVRVGLDRAAQQVLGLAQTPQPQVSGPQCRQCVHVQALAPGRTGVGLQREIEFLRRHQPVAHDQPVDIGLARDAGGVNPFALGGEVRRGAGRQGTATGRIFGRAGGIMGGREGLSKGWFGMPKARPYRAMVQAAIGLAAPVRDRNSPTFPRSRRPRGQSG